MNKKEFNKSKIHTSLTPGQSLKIIRELQELSQNELAQMTGISQPNLSSLENNSRQIGRERALVLASALKVHPAVILFPDFDVNAVA